MAAAGSAQQDSIRQRFNFRQRAVQSLWRIAANSRKELLTVYNYRSEIPVSKIIQELI